MISSYQKPYHVIRMNNQSMRFHWTTQWLHNFIISDKMNEYYRLHSPTFRLFLWFLFLLFWQTINNFSLNQWVFVFTCFLLVNSHFSAFVWQVRSWLAIQLPTKDLFWVTSKAHKLSWNLLKNQWLLVILYILLRQRKIFFVWFSVSFICWVLSGIKMLLKSITTNNR